MRRQRPDQKSDQKSEQRQSELRSQRRNQFVKKKLRRALLIGFCSIAPLIGLVLFDWLRLGSNLPILDASNSQRILDRYGQEIRHALSVNGERRYLIPLTEISVQLSDAFILAEDRHFFTHHGVDWKALLRGVGQSFRQFRKVSGGSTITMQLVRTLWPEMSGSIHKPAQILQALRIESKYSKGEILSQYLNTISFGNKISGVGAACRYFFDKSCSQLSIGQISALAILPRNPSYFLRNPKALVQRRNSLLKKMLLNNSDQLILKQAEAEPIELKRVTPDFFAPHLAERILEEQKNEAEIQTTIDLELQKSIQSLLAAETIGRPGTGDSGAVLVLENETGAVLAYVGSPDYFNQAHGMVDGVKVLRSPGSALKPFIYELGLENNWNLFSIVPDIPMLFSTQRAVYEPNNYGGDFSGPRTIREALGNSKNLPALYLTSKLGEANVLNHLRRLGFSSLTRDAAYYGVGLALGNGEVSLWELTQAYSTLARLGIAIQPTYYLKNLSRAKRVLPEETAYLIADVLRDPEARKEEFSRFGPLEFNYEVGVKTGTSSDYRDNWTVGFTKKITVGVWRGNANSSPMIKRIPASRGTGPLFHKVMDLAHLHQNPSWLVRPEPIEQTRVCAFSGQLPGKNCTLTHLELHSRNQAPVHECEVHKSIEIANCHGVKKTIVYVEPPKEYEEWSKASHIPTLKNQLLELCGITDYESVIKTTNLTNLEIIEPLDGTTYAIDPTIPLSHQEVRFTLRHTGSSAGVQVLADDKVVDVKVEENEFFWPLKKGKYKFLLKKGDLVSNAVSIQVR